MVRKHICLSWPGSLILSFTCNFFAYFKFHSDWGRVIGKIKQNELDCRDTASLIKPVFNGQCVLIARLATPKSSQTPVWLIWMPTLLYFFLAVNNQNKNFCKRWFVFRNTDILVGAPYYTTVKDEGRVFIYLNNGQVCYILQGTDGMKILKPSTPNKQI